MISRCSMGLRAAKGHPRLTHACLGINTARHWSLKPDFSKFKKIPQPPGYIVGTVNDAYEPPAPDFFHGGYHWTYERFVSIGMVPVVLVPFVAGVEFPVIDAIFSSMVLFHCHGGFQSCIIDYIPKRVYGIWHSIAMRLLDLGTATAIYGIYLIETTENGVFDLVRQLFVS